MSNDLFTDAASNEAFIGDDSVAFVETTDDYPTETLPEDEVTGIEADDTEWLYDGSESDIASEGIEEDPIADAGDTTDIVMDDVQEETLLDEATDGVEEVTEVLDDESNSPYLFGWGEGWAYVEASPDPALEELNTLQFGEGIAAEDILFESDGTNLTIRIAGTDNEIIVTNFLSQDDIDGSSNPLQQIVFSDGSTLDLGSILGMVTYPETVPVSEEPDWEVTLAVIDPFVEFGPWEDYFSGPCQGVSTDCPPLLIETDPANPELVAIGSSGMDGTLYYHGC